MNIKVWVYQKQIKVVIVSFIFGFVYVLNALLKENAVEKWQACILGLGAGVVCFCLLNVCYFLMILDRENWKDNWKDNCKKKSYGGTILFAVFCIIAFLLYSMFFDIFSGSRDE